MTGWQDVRRHRCCWKSGEDLLIPFAPQICVEIDVRRRSGSRWNCPEDLKDLNRQVIFHVLTIFPEFFEGPFAHGVVAKAREAGLLDIRIHNLRDWTSDRHKTVDDRPFGGGEGMVLKPEPIFQAVESIWPERTARAEGYSAVGAGTAVRSGVARRLSQESGTAADLRPV